MKDGVLATAGKTIRGVIVKERHESPHRQLFFVFSGGRDAVLQYMSSGKVVLDSFADMDERV